MGESRLVGIANTECARCNSARTEKNITGDTIKERRANEGGRKREETHDVANALTGARAKVAKVEQQGRDEFCKSGSPSGWVERREVP